MVELYAWNPIYRQQVVIKSLDYLSINEAQEEAEAHLLSLGLRCGTLKDGESEKLIFGFVEQSSSAELVGGNNYTPNPDAYFYFKQMADRYKITSVLDLGCGKGGVLMAAKTAFGKNTRVCGAELDAELLQVARHLMPSAELFEADLPEWVPPVNDFDLIYMYEPLYVAELQTRLLEHLKSWMTEGQKLYYKRDERKREIPSWLKPLGSDLFQKGEL